MNAPMSPDETDVRCQKVCKTLRRSIKVDKMYQVLVNIDNIALLHGVSNMVSRFNHS